MDQTYKQNEHPEFSEFSSFSNFSETKETILESNQNLEKNPWVADFEFPDENEVLSQNPLTSKNTCSLVSSSQTALEKCFGKDKYKYKSIEGNSFNNYIDSPLYQCLQTQQLDPVKHDDLVLKEEKISTVKSLLNFTQTEETWIAKVQQITLGFYRHYLDYHKLIEKNITYGNTTPSVVTPVNSSERDLVKNKNKENTATLLQLEEDLAKTTKELLPKSVDDLKEIVFELDIQAKIYSELLLTELDYRDKLKRDQEIKNAFVASYVAVERKQAEKEKRRKNKYTFFKNSDHDTSHGVTIPYIHRDGGPTTTDLSLMIEILKSIEREDQRTPKLISDYVMNLGEEFELQTVIKVRTSDGLATLSQ